MGNILQNLPAGELPDTVVDALTRRMAAADPMADLSITQSADPNPVLVGSVLTYSLLVSNRGPGAATATVMDLLPPEVSFVSALSSRGLCAEQDGLVSCTLSNLFSGASATVDIQVVAVHSGNPTNLVAVSGTALDLNPIDNQVALVTTVLSPPITILAQPQSQAVLVGQTAVFQVSATSTLPLSYQWQHNGNDLLGATNQTLTLVNAQPNDAGTYQVQIRHIDAMVTSAGAQLDVFLQPPNPLILAVQRVGNVVTITVTTVPGLVYSLEAQDEFPAPTWSLVENATGTGQPLTLTDRNAPAVMRFYRVRGN